MMMMTNNNNNNNNGRGGGRGGVRGGGRGAAPAVVDGGAAPAVVDGGAAPAVVKAEEFGAANRGGRGGRGGRGSNGGAGRGARGGRGRGRGRGNDSSSSSSSSSSDADDDGQNNNNNNEDAAAGAAPNQQKKKQYTRKQKDEFLGPYYDSVKGEPTFHHNSIYHPHMFKQYEKIREFHERECIIAPLEILVEKYVTKGSENEETYNAAAFDAALNFLQTNPQGPVFAVNGQRFPFRETFQTFLFAQAEIKHANNRSVPVVKFWSDMGGDITNLLPALERQRIADKQKCDKFPELHPAPLLAPQRPAGAIKGLAGPPFSERDFTRLQTALKSFRAAFMAYCNDRKLKVYKKAKSANKKSEEKNAILASLAKMQAYAEESRRIQHREMFVFNFQNWMQQVAGPHFHDRKKVSRYTLVFHIVKASRASYISQPVKAFVLKHFNIPEEYLSDEIDSDAGIAEREEWCQLAFDSMEADLASMMPATREERGNFSYSGNDDDNEGDANQQMNGDDDDDDDERLQQE